MRIQFKYAVTDMSHAHSSNQELSLTIRFEWQEPYFERQGSTGDFIQLQCQERITVELWDRNG